MLKDLKICGENINYLTCYLEKHKAALLPFYLLQNKLHMEQKF